MKKFTDKNDIERARDMCFWHRRRMVLSPTRRRTDDAHRIPYEHYRKVMRKLFIEKLFIQI